MSWALQDFLVGYRTVLEMGAVNYSTMNFIIFVCSDLSFSCLALSTAVILRATFTKVGFEKKKTHTASLATASVNAFFWSHTCRDQIYMQ